MVLLQTADERYRQGLWVTQAKNGPAFTEAFKECQSVILFFSINKSHGFQGFVSQPSILMLILAGNTTDRRLHRHA